MLVQMLMWTLVWSSRSRLMPSTSASYQSESTKLSMVEYCSLVALLKPSKSRQMLSTSALSIGLMAPLRLRTLVKSLHSRQVLLTSLLHPLVQRLM